MCVCVCVYTNKNFRDFRIYIYIYIYIYCSWSSEREVKYFKMSQKMFSNLIFRHLLFPIFGLFASFGFTSS